MTARPALIALLVLVGFGRILWTGEAPTKAQQLTGVPAQVGLWVGTPLEVAELEQRVLEGGDLRVMEYRMGEEPPVWLALEGGIGKRASFHPPEICYVGSEFEILEREPMTFIAGGAPRRLMRLVISRNDKPYEAWYWFTADDRMTHNYYQQQLWLVLDAIRGKRTFGTLVRISTPADSPEATYRRLLAFLSSYTERPAIRVAQLAGAGG